MRYYVSFLRRRLAGVRYGWIAVALVLSLILSVLSGRLSAFLLPWGGLLLWFPVIGFVVECARSADLASEDDTGHLLPIAERQMVLGVALSLLLSFVILCVVEAILFGLLFLLPYRGFQESGILFSSLGERGIPLFGSILLQGIFAISLLLLVQFWRRLLMQRSRRENAWPLFARVLWDGFFFLIAWALLYLAAQWGMVRFPFALDLSNLVIQSVPPAPTMVWHPFLWTLTPPIFPSVFTQWNLAPLLLEVVGTILFFTVTTSIAEDALDW